MILENVRLIDEAETTFLLPYELKELESKTPEYVTDEMWKKSYGHWIQIYLEQAYGGFKIGSFTTSPDCLLSAERTLIEAREKGLDFDESIIEDAIGKILKLDRVNNFIGNRTLLSYIKSSKLDLGKYEKEIEERLPDLASEYSKALVRGAKNAARRMKNLGKVHYVPAKKIKNHLNAIENLEPYGIDEEESINEIKKRAYKSILFALSVGKDSVYNNPRKSKRWLELASKNASVLGFDISYHTRTIEELYDSFGFVEIKNDL